MNRGISRYALSIIAIVLVLVQGCKKDDDTNTITPNNPPSSAIPVLSTTVASAITSNSAVSGGEIISDGQEDITSRGVCWSTSPSPTISDVHTSDGSGTGSFQSSLTGLTSGQSYYYRAYATNKAGTGYGKQKSLTATATIAIGSFHAGGIIFYIDGTGSHGLVCSSTDHTTVVQWGCPNMGIAGADGTSIGDGSQNTHDIIAGCSAPGTAAYVCNNLIESGYNDWYLPSKDELGLMYTNLKLNGLGNFSTGAYWSSSEVDDQYAWEIIFDSGFAQGGSKNILSNVRAVRTF